MNIHTKTKIVFCLFALLVVLYFGLNKGFVSLAKNVGTSLEVLDEVRGFVRWATPEGRTGTAGTNDDSAFSLRIKDPGTHATLYATGLLETAVDGTYLSPITFSPFISSGQYDVGFKGAYSLTKTLRNVNLINGDTYLNFTQADNSSAKGSIRLVAGDVDGAGIDSATIGDDVINSVDLSVMIHNLDGDDPSGNSVRANINQDSVVNSVDLSLMISNLDREGEQ